MTPDYYSATGQLWGNPVYNWAAHKKTGYAWWIWRMKSNMALFDVVRLDHFRGFAAYWEVDAAEDTAVNGKWRKGPGMELFRAIEKALGPIPLIAEDLGVQTDEVRELLSASGFPGMRVLIFGFTPDYDNEHLPHNYLPNSIVYTSTHDSQTVCEQIMDICSEPEKQFASGPAVARRGRAHEHPGDHRRQELALARACRGAQPDRSHASRRHHENLYARITHTPGHRQEEDSKDNEDENCDF